MARAAWGVQAFGGVDDPHVFDLPEQVIIGEGPADEWKKYAPWAILAAGVLVVWMVRKGRRYGR
jgi:hypothetical protein